MINSILISYDWSKPVMKGSSAESIEEARNEYKKLSEEGFKKLIDSIAFKEKWLIIFNPKFDIIKNKF